MEKTNLNELQKSWLSRVERFKKSGLTQSDFCRDNKYNLKQFNYWLKKFEKIELKQLQAEAPKWISVNITEPLNSSFLSVKIGAATVEVAHGFNKQLLADIVEALSKL